MDLARELKKMDNTRVTEIPIVVGVLGTVREGLGKGLGGIEYQKNRDYQDYDIVKIGKNT